MVTTRLADVADGPAYLPPADDVTRAVTRLVVSVYGRTPEEMGWSVGCVVALAAGDEVFKVPLRFTSAAPTA